MARAEETARRIKVAPIAPTRRQSRSTASRDPHHKPRSSSWMRTVPTTLSAATPIIDRATIVIA